MEENVEWLVLSIDINDNLVVLCNSSSRDEAADIARNYAIESKKFCYLTQALKIQP